jgi:hypothetical protein
MLIQPLTYLKIMSIPLVLSTLLSVIILLIALTRYEKSKQK